jgi:hypothetical protein
MTDPIAELVEPYTRLLMGQNGVHVSLNFVVQRAGEGRIIVIGQSSVPYGPHPLQFGGTRTHQLVMGDAIIRPRAVVDSDHLRGSGAIHILTTGMADIGEWLSHGHILIDPLTKADQVVQAMRGERRTTI